MRKMIACIDVGYDDDADLGRAACVVLSGWKDERPAEQYVVNVSGLQPYQPGQFYRRELPCLLAVIDELAQPPDVVVIDGYVFLSGDGEKGLGGYLFESLGEKTPVIGVAKTKFVTADAVEVFRGHSDRPLFVTAAGMHQTEAADLIRQMHGEHRLPTLLRLADQLSRVNETGNSAGNSAGTDNS